MDFISSISFTIASMVIYLGINITMKVKFYSSNYKTLKKEIKEDTRGCEDLPCSWNSKINTAEIVILSKGIYKFSIIPNKVP
jgi:hypothetical protein